MASGTIYSGVAPFSRGGTGATSKATAKEALDISQYSEIRSIATGAEDHGFKVTFAETQNFSVLYTDTHGRAALISHHQGEAATITVLCGTFNATSVDTTNAYLNTGTFVRCNMVVAAINPATITTSVY